MTDAFGNADAEAANRHRHLAAMFDDFSTARIAGLGGVTNKRCLELGAGGGSMAARLAALWWWLTDALDIRAFFLPSPPDIVAAFRQQPGYLVAELGHTVASTLLGFGPAAAAGVLIAIGLTSSGLIQRATLPLLVAVNAVPKVAIAPLLLALLSITLFYTVVAVERLALPWARAVTG